MRGNGFCGSIGWVGRISALGSRLLLSSEYNRVATPSCLRLFTQTMLQALALTTAGSSRPARMAMMAITTSNSISVNARFDERPPGTLSPASGAEEASSRFMDRLDPIFGAHWDHEPMEVSLARPSDTLSPSGGEGWGEGVRRFMSIPHGFLTAHWDHEPRGCVRRRDSVLDCGSPLPLLHPQTRSKSARGLAQSKTWRAMENAPFAFPNGLGP